MAVSPKQFIVRFPGDMRDRIAQRAQANGRSMNAEILAIIEDALNDAPETQIIALIEEAKRVRRDKMFAEHQALTSESRLAAIESELREKMGDDFAADEPLDDVIRRYIASVMDARQRR